MMCHAIQQTDMATKDVEAQRFLENAQTAQSNQLVGGVELGGKAPSQELETAAMETSIAHAERRVADAEWRTADVERRAADVAHWKDACWHDAAAPLERRRLC